MSSNETFCRTFRLIKLLCDIRDHLHMVTPRNEKKTLKKQTLRATSKYRSALEEFYALAQQESLRTFGKLKI